MLTSSLRFDAYDSSAPTDLQQHQMDEPCNVIRSSAIKHSPSLNSMSETRKESEITVRGSDDSLDRPDSATCTNTIESASSKFGDRTDQTNQLTAEMDITFNLESTKYSSEVDRQLHASAESQRHCTTIDRKVSSTSSRDLPSFTKTDDCVHSVDKRLQTLMTTSDSLLSKMNAFIAGQINNDVTLTIAGQHSKIRQQMESHAYSVWNLFSQCAEIPAASESKSQTSTFCLC